MENMKKCIVIVGITSTGFNYVDDVKARGYQPVVLESEYVFPGTDEDRAPFLATRELTMKRLPKDIPMIEDSPDYNVLLERVRAYDPILVIPGQEFSVELATHLADDLGLPGNPWSMIGKMTRKNEMQQALAEHGVRSIRGRIVRSEADAEAFYRELDTTHIVIKRARGACTQGLHFCEGLDEALEAVRTELALSASADSVGDILMQERIIGTEYIVNTVSRKGRHRFVSMWKYDKVPVNGSNVYNYMQVVTRLEVGHSSIINYAYDVLDAIGIQWGPVHGEYMVDEKGPVLIEINCRPMGGAMNRHYVDKLFGQHETDSILDAYLDPVKFEQDSRKPYRPLRMGIGKFFILPKDVNIESAPVLQLVRQLRSFYDASFERIGREDLLNRTRDLETAGGYVYLVHDDEQVVMDDCALLHQVEMQYPQLLFNELQPVSEASLVARQPLEQMLQDIDCCGTTLVFSDSGESSDRAVVLNGSQLPDAYDAYEQGLLDISRYESFGDIESLVQQIFMFLSKLKFGAHVYIPASTYCHLPYGINGMEILLQVVGLRIEAPLAKQNRMMIASKR